MRALLKKVLFVDDSRTMRLVIKSLLIKLGYTDCLEAEDGLVARDLLNQHKIDLILTDWNMPNLNGAELVKYVRSSDEHKHIAIIALTSKDDTKSALDHGANETLTKPFSAAVLEKKIEQVFNTQAD